MPSFPRSALDGIAHESKFREYVVYTPASVHLAISTSTRCPFEVIPDAVGVIWYIEVIHRAA